MKTINSRNFKLWSIFAVLLAAALIVSGCGKSVAPVPQPVPSVTASLPSSTAPPVITSLTTTTVPPSSIPVTGIEAKNIVKKVVGNMASVSSYGFTRDNTQSYSSKADKSDEVTNRTFSQTLVDVSGLKLAATNKTTTKQPADKPTWPVVQNAICVIKDIMYIQGLFPEEPQSWSKTTITPAIWQIQNQAQLVTDFLNIQNITGMTREITRFAEGEKECVVVKINPDPEQLWTFFINQPGIKLLPKPPEGLTLNQIIKNSGINILIDQSSGMLLQANFDMDVYISPELLPSFKTTFNSSIKVNLLFRNYNQSTDIILPEGAENATELSLQKSLQ